MSNEEEKCFDCGMLIKTSHLLFDVSYIIREKESNEKTKEKFLCGGCIFSHISFNKIANKEKVFAIKKLTAN